MIGRVKMRRRVFILRRIAATDMTAGLADAQMHPLVAHFKALFATLRRRRHVARHPFEMWASFHSSPMACKITPNIVMFIEGGKCYAFLKMSDKIKRGLAISALALAHLFATFVLNVWLFSHAMSQLDGEYKRTNFLAPTVKTLLVAFEFPLVHLVKLIPYAPDLPSSSLVAFAYPLSYFANSILWGTIVYGIFRFVAHKRVLRRN